MVLQGFKKFYANHSEFLWQLPPRLRTGDTRQAIDVHLNKSIINIHPQLNRSTTSKLKTPSITTINAKKYSTIAEKLF